MSGRHLILLTVLQNSFASLSSALIRVSRSDLDNLTFSQCRRNQKSASLLNEKGVLRCRSNRKH